MSFKSQSDFGSKIAPYGAGPFFAVVEFSYVVGCKGRSTTFNCLKVQNGLAWLENLVRKLIYLMHSTYYHNTVQIFHLQWHIY